jgi:hypothetical protein
MGAMRQVPVPMPTTELADLLAQLAEGVRTGDSLEGHIEWLLDYDEEAPKYGTSYHMVQASFRVGNRQGQGGMEMLGKLTELTPGYVRAELDRAIRDALPFAGRRVEILLRALATELADVSAKTPERDRPTLMKRVANAHAQAADAEQAVEDAAAKAQRVPSRVQARDEVCLDPEHCDIPGHRPGPPEE